MGWLIFVGIMIMIMVAPLALTAIQVWLEFALSDPCPTSRELDGLTDLAREGESIVASLPSEVSASDADVELHCPENNNVSGPPSQATVDITLMGLGELTDEQLGLLMDSNGWDRQVRSHFRIDGEYTRKLDTGLARASAQRAEDEIELHLSMPIH